MTRRSKRRTALTLLVGFLLLVPIPASAGGGMASCPEAASDSGEPGSVAVLDSCFRPQTLTVKTGEVVRWEQKGSMPHTVTFDQIDSEEIKSSFSARFNGPGTYTYFCKFHGRPGYGMFGTVVVEGNQLPGDTIEPVDTSGGAFASAPVSQPKATLLAASQDDGEVDVRIRIDPGTAFAFALIAFFFGAGATVVVQAGRR